jgi:hypothetical protein
VEDWAHTATVRSFADPELKLPSPWTHAVIGVPGAASAGLRPAIPKELPPVSVATAAITVPPGESRYTVPGCAAVPCAAVYPTTTDPAVADAIRSPLN